MSERGEEWLAFSEYVNEHVEGYTIDQYGDKGDDYLTDKTPEFCVQQIDKYVRRFGKPHRLEEKAIDMKKIAHYACVAFFKLKGGGGG